MHNYNIIPGQDVNGYLDSLIAHTDISVACFTVVVHFGTDYRITYLRDGGVTVRRKIIKHTKGREITYWRELPAISSAPTLVYRAAKRAFAKAWGI